MTRLWVVAGLLATLACHSGTSPLAGLVKVNLTNPNSGTDGAILVSVTGPAAPMSVSAPGGLRVFSASPFGTTNSFAITGNIQTGTILTLGVADTTAAATRYTVLIQQVAKPNYQLRTSLFGYSVQITK